MLRKEENAIWGESRGGAQVSGFGEFLPILKLQKFENRGVHQKAK
jgi:hypothetical protein